MRKLFLTANDERTQELENKLGRDFTKYLDSYITEDKQLRIQIITVKPHNMERIYGIVSLLDVDEVVIFFKEGDSFFNPHINKVKSFCSTRQINLIEHQI
jgi:hypothetical protein